MMNIKISKQLLSGLLVMTVLFMSIAGPASAALISTDQTAEAVASADASAERARVRNWLAREDVVRQMRDLGVSATEAQQRVAALSDEEARDLAGKMDELPAGGDVIGVLFAVFIVLLVTDILGVTKVFPFTRSVR
jgi:hypothetical protein